MSKRFPHVYSFRLSDADAEEYTWLLKRFQLGSISDKSRAFRGLIRELHKAFMEMKFQSLGAQAPAGQLDIRDPSAAGPGSTEEDEELSPYDEDPEEPQDDPEYHRLRKIAVQRLMNRGEPLLLETLVREIEQLRKEGKGIPRPPNQEEELIERFP